MDASENDGEYPHNNHKFNNQPIITPLALFAMNV